MKKIILIFISFFALNSSAKDLVVGMELGYPPFEMSDKTGKASGISVDFLEAFAKKNGYKLVVKNIAWDGLIPALKTLIFTLFIFNIVHAIATEATLSFFGLGLGFEIPTLGTLLSESSKAVFIGAWWIILFPLLSLLLLFLPLLWLGNFLQKIWGIRS